MVQLSSGHQAGVIHDSSQSKDRSQIKPRQGNHALMTFGQFQPGKRLTEKLEIIAHRGVRTHADSYKMAPENTLPALIEADKLGIGIELDVMATSDGVVVVHHDDETGKIFSLPNGPQTVVKTPFTVLQAAQLNIPGFEASVDKMLGNFPQLDGSPRFKMHPSYQDVRIPTLDNTLNALKKSHLYIELKTDTADASKNNNLEERTVNLVKAKGLQNRVTFISFCRGSLKKIKQLDPTLKTGLDYITPGWMKGWGEGLLLRYAKYVLKVDSVHPPYQEVTPKLVDQAHKLGLKMTPWVWHETRAEEAKRVPELEKMGVDGVISNAVDLFR